MRRVILLASMLTLALISNSHAMRCGTHLINEGDSVSRMLQLCGDPTWSNASDIVYTNKDGDGMNYYIHVSGSGMIDSINFRR